MLSNPSNLINLTSQQNLSQHQWSPFPEGMHTTGSSKCGRWNTNIPDPIGASALNRLAKAVWSSRPSMRPTGEAHSQLQSLTLHENPHSLKFQINVQLKWKEHLIQRTNFGLPDLGIRSVSSRQWNRIESQWITPNQIKSNCPRHLWQFALIWFDSTWFDLIRFDLIRFDLTRLD